MLYGILNKNKFIFLDDDKQKLLNVLPHIGKKESDIIEVSEDSVEMGYDNNYYKKGKSPKQPLAEYNLEQEQKRSQAYIERADVLSLRKLRKQALNKWTEEDEALYIEEMQIISEEIEKEFPYRTK